ncbi:MAG: T9SS type A sorting domain-containing protein [Flavobacteriaceae bacterium]|nr:T9SS type A sorting domain-containing protein [Flavobacteriaceae bacterium]
MTKPHSVQYRISYFAVSKNDNFNFNTSGNLNLNLKFDKTYKEIKSVISDLSGKTLLTTSANNIAELTLDISALSKGIYILNIITEDGFYVEKIVKK